MPSSAKPRIRLARWFVATAERWMQRKLVPILYPLPAADVRHGYGRPPHPELLELLAAGESAYARNLQAIATYQDDLTRIQLAPTTEPVPHWLNAWLPALDASALYAFIRDRQPARYVEIGSGMSTLFAHQAIADGGLSTTITSIDPQPRAEVEALCDRAIRAPLEEADLSVFDDVGSGDVVFMDGSHQVFAGSDATVFFLEVLPRLPNGVLVSVHDILLPDDYLPEWQEFHWAEQYLMGTYLLARGTQIQLELAANYVGEYSSQRELLTPLWDALGLERGARRGFCLWFSTVGR